MDRKQQRMIKNTATLKNTLLLGLLVLIVACFIMPEATKQIKQYAHETGLLDALFYYGPDQVYHMISAYGEKGRRLYIAVELTADLFFSIATAAFLTSLLIWSASKSRNKSVKLKYLLLLPGLSLIANCLENGGIIWMLAHFPEKYFFLALATSFLTTSKWILIIICFALAGWNLLRKAFLKPSVVRNTIPENSVADEQQF